MTPSPPRPRFFGGVPNEWIEYAAELEVENRELREALEAERARTKKWREEAKDHRP